MPDTPKDQSRRLDSHLPTWLTPESFTVANLWQQPRCPGSRRPDAQSVAHSTTEGNSDSGYNVRQPQ